MDIHDLLPLCREFSTRPDIAILAHGRTAVNKCGSTARKFQEFLEMHGIRNHCILSVYGYKIPTPDTSAYPIDYDWNRFGHTVVIVDDWWVDWTARQMDADKPFPFIGDARTEIKNWKATGL